MDTGNKFLTRLLLILIAAINQIHASTQLATQEPLGPVKPLQAPYGIAANPEPQFAALSLSPQETGSESNAQQASSSVNQVTSKLRINVSNVCEKNHMRITVRLSRPFYGLIHTKDFRRRPACLADGTGEQSYTLDIAYTQIQSDTNYCGVVSHHLARLPAQPISTQPLGQSSAINQSAQASTVSLSQQQQQTLSVALVVRLHKTIEFSDDRYFLLSCANRCSRPDCSSNAPAQITTSPQSSAQQSRNFVASESIVSPVLRPAGGDPSKLVDPLSSWITQRCDSMLDIKFSWLARLCWLLAALLLITICVAIYLSYQLYKRATKLQSQPSKRRSLSRSAGNQSMRDIDRAHRSEPTRDVEANLLSKVYESNSFLAEQNKQLILANQFLSNNQLNSFVQQPQTEIQQVRSIERPMIVGRNSGYESSFSTGHVTRRQQVEAQLKGRRSIGSSMAKLVPQNNQESIGRDRFLGASQRLKSRSQSKIHYDQSQEPFKAITFSYQDANNNNGSNSGYLYSYSH